MEKNKNRLVKKERYDFQDLLEIVAILRSPEGCPGDREQTHRDLRNNLIEEAYEVCEGIDRDDKTLLCEELGDVLLQVVFHAGIAGDEGAFTIDDVIHGVAKKMIDRHPHVFTSQTEIKTWEEIKKEEKGDLTQKDELERIARSLPALIRAEKFIKKKAPTVTANSPLLQGGEALYGQVSALLEKGISPEEALNRYLEECLKKCTNCE